MHDDRPLPSRWVHRSRAVALTARPQSPIERFTDRVWFALHALGVHRWQDGYEIDPSRGMSQYRGSRCAVCDSPWEGW